MILFLFLIWTFYPVHERPVSAGDFTPPNSVIKYREIWICPPNAPVHVGFNVYWLNHGEVYFYKPLEIQINREW